MGHHSSSSRYVSNSPDGYDSELDPETYEMIAELGLQDITEMASRKSKAGGNVLSSDEEIALAVQRDVYDETIRTIKDNRMAKNLGHTIDRQVWRAASIAEQAAQDDRRAALALSLSSSEQLPPRSSAQRLMDHKFLQEDYKLPSKGGRDSKAKTFAHNPEDTDNALSEVFGEAIRGMRPRYMRYNYWSEADVPSETLADWSKTAKPLPGPPEAELKNPAVVKTVTNNPALFKIVTPIHVDVFEKLLVDHPNPAFVASVCKGLREGFWPFADTRIGEYPDRYDGSKMPRNPAEAEFLRKQRDIELDKGRFSESFGKNLLPGMYSSPIHAVPKRGGDFRLVTDHSGGKYSLNSMIDYDDIAGMPLDDMRHLGEKLIEAHARGRKLTLWKSDVAEAYRLCPMHRHWQIKQVNTIDGQRYIDRNNTFGGRASFKIWGSVNSLVMWIAENLCKIDRPFCYNDDTFGVCDANDTQFYAPYNRSMPRDQCKLLELWDVLGIPHKEKKQLSGSPLTIIGIEVDANRMTMTLPADAKAAVIADLNRFIAQPNGKAGSFSYKEFQHFAGGMNAALNVFPLLRPALTNIFAKIGEVDRNLGGSNTQILCDAAMRDDLNWALKHIQNSKGIRILQDARAWKAEEADITLFTNSNLRSIAFWYPNRKPNVAYYFNTHDTPSNLEHFLKALVVASAFLDAASRQRSASKIVIYTDDSGTVNIFDSFRCSSPIYNHLLREVADVMIKEKHKLKVLHVSAKKNEIATLVSRGSFDEARKRVPGLAIAPFKPSDKLLGPLNK